MNDPITPAGFTAPLPVAPSFARAADALVAAARIILPDLELGRAVRAPGLRAAMESAFGGSDADGAWDWKAAYDACEAAQILFFRKYAKALFRKSASPAATLAMVEKVAALLPTHTRRSETSQALQQFSTPAGLAFITAFAASIRPGELVLEPSAGSGLLAVHAEAAGGRLALNELGETRAELLARLFEGSTVTRYDAAQIHDYLDPAIAPSVVLMNPPFSAVAHVGRAMKDAALRHITSALARLAPGGRLVAITGAGCSPHAPAWLDAFTALQKSGRVIFSAAIDGRVYAKHGTTIDTRLTVIDRVPAADPAAFPVSPGVAPDLATLLGWVRDLVPPRDPTPAPSGNALPIRPSALPVSHALKPLRISPTPAKAPLPAPELIELAYDVVDWTPARSGRLTDAIYEPYALQSLCIANAKPHPTPLVQSAAMASVAPPKPSYRPHLPESLVTDGLLSDAQLESVSKYPPAKPGAL